MPEEGDDRRRAYRKGQRLTAGGGRAHFLVERAPPEPASGEEIHRGMKTVKDAPAECRVRLKPLPPEFEHFAEAADAAARLAATDRKLASDIATLAARFAQVRKQLDELKPKKKTK
jgi:hypothetical protein